MAHASSPGTGGGGGRTPLSSLATAGAAAQVTLTAATILNLPPRPRAVPQRFRDGATREDVSAGFRQANRVGRVQRMRNHRQQLTPAERDERRERRRQQRRSQEEQEQEHMRRMLVEEEMADQAEAAAAAVDDDDMSISSVDEAARRELEAHARGRRGSTPMEQQAAVKRERRGIHNYTGTRAMAPELKELVDLHYNKDPKAALYKYIGDTNYDERRALVQSLPRTDRPEELESPEGVAAIDNMVNRIRSHIPTPDELARTVAWYRSRMDNDRYACGTGDG